MKDNTEIVYFWGNEAPCVCSNPNVRDQNILKTFNLSQLYV